MRISDWSSDVCSSDLQKEPALQLRQAVSVLGHEEVSFVRLQPPREQRGLPWPETLRLHYFCVMSRPRNISGGARNMTETWLHGLAAPRRRPGNFRRAIYLVRVSSARKSTRLNSSH